MTMTVSQQMADGVYIDDKRLYPQFQHKGDVRIRAERKSERQWHYCKYCYEDAPTFILTEAFYRKNEFVDAQRLRCCWQCGSGLEILEDAE